MNHVASELLRAIRGPRSQMAFARRLGYRSNTAADWEAGRRFPTGLVTLKACVRVGIDVVAAMDRFMSSVDAHALCSHLDDAGLALWLSALKGKQSIVSIAQSTGHSRYSVSRWFSGKSHPRLPEFLSLIQACTHRVGDFLDELVGIEHIPSLRQEQQARRILQELAWTVPWTEAILRVLETEHYRQRKNASHQYIANYLGLSPEIVQSSLALLEQANVVSWDGTHHLLSEVLTVDTHRHPEAFWKLLEHWQKVIHERLQTEHLAVVNYNVFACSQADYQTIVNLQRAHFEQIRAIVAQSGPSETVALLQNNLLSLGIPKGRNTLGA
ncbi:MAG: hypothetical protein IPJ88_17490 [Myxococcales bacterium]|nr:MAG: hypothetical protein IPJ88_17490 [Myxococcales bacterium]